MPIRAITHSVMLIISAWFSSGISQEPFAVITNVSKKGRVFVKSDTSHSWKEAHTGTCIGIGDSIKTIEGANATILYYNSGREFINGRQVIQPQEGGAPPWLSLVWKRLTSNQENLTEMGASRGETGVLLCPRAGKLLSIRPIMIRTASAQHKIYRVQLYEAASQKLVWQTTSQDTLIAYPENAPALVDSQEYRVQILPRGQFYPAAAETGTFFIASLSERNAIASWRIGMQNQYASHDSSDITIHLVLASFFFQNAYYLEAYHEIQRALTKQPDNYAMRLLLLDWYRAVNLPSLHERLREKLAQ